ncbi:MAG: hypothetical protein A3K19_23985 [Lentisphaerae bacterium RIFOXYB12_FULL_65_16]|nr:MAG: hypothetical protein A3K18_10300 [Lentisphaerae bacterium RIFOXYA12_64_32]OGV89579.1 MAG: hypothetical protein A3K19_23985 [Lentisphaerae bacterium RIFOXYB12_FULL_65_16]
MTAFCLLAGCVYAQAPVAENAQENTAMKPPATETFKPRLVRAVLPADRFRPGGTLPVSLVFANDGAPAAESYHVFVHLETERDCKTAFANSDHEPTVPTTLWKTGQEIEDGPCMVSIPAGAKPGPCWVHIGVYVWEPQHIRFCDEYVRQVEIDPAAPDAKPQFEPLAVAELARRYQALEARLADSATLDSPSLSLRVAKDGSAFALLDKASGVTWHSNPGTTGLGSADVQTAEKKAHLLFNTGTVETSADTIRVRYRDTADSALEITVLFRLLPDGKTIDFSYETAAGIECQGIRFPEDGFWVTDAEQGAVLVPIREGVLIPADSGVVFRRAFDTYGYESCHMAMIGLLKQGSAALLSWSDPYVTIDIKSTWAAGQAIPGRQLLAPTVALRKSARSFQIRLLGKGDAVTVAQAYREVATQRGLVQTWDEKVKRNPLAENLIGASNVKLWTCFIRNVDADGTVKGETMNWTFDEAAAVAEHLRNDLQMERVLFILGGWIHRGYDSQHPDILPTAPECGGDAKFAEAMQRIAATGYLPGLHDNYQDIYRDAPSWDEKLIMKDAKGNLVKGGKWAGGQAWLTCSKTAVDLAKRPQNLPAVRSLSGPCAYFIDTTYAVGLQECFDPAHPLTRADDMKYKCDISDYARDTLGLFGSECGREWAVPHADFFEGLTGVSGRYYHNEAMPECLGATVIPLFEMVYRDCIAMYGKYGYSPESAASYVLHHISIGRPLHYHSMGTHLYWQKAEEKPLPLTPSIAAVEPAGEDAVNITYAWQVTGPVEKDWRVFVHFVDPGATSKILFQDDHVPEPAMTTWQPGVVCIGPRTVQIPKGKTGAFEVRIGMWDPQAGNRARLAAPDGGGRSYRLGLLAVDKNGPKLLPVPESPDGAGQDCFVQADGGWAEGLNLTDRFLKNTHEVLSPLHELTARVLLTKLEFLTPDRRARRTTFGDKAVATVNDRTESLTVRRGDGTEVVLPPRGFLVETPEFVAFHAQTWGSVKYEQPALFTLRSLDGQPLATSKRIRVFHAFGPARCDVNGRMVEVKREMVVE